MSAARFLALLRAIRRPPPPAPAPVELVGVVHFDVIARGRRVARYRIRELAEQHAQRLHAAGESWLPPAIVAVEVPVPLEHARAELRQAQADALEERRQAHAGEVAS